MSSVGRKADIPNFVNGQIQALKKEGYSQIEISRRLKMSRCAVQNAIYAYKTSVHGLSRRCMAGRKRRTSGREDRFLKIICARSPHASSARVV